MVFRSAFLLLFTLSILQASAQDYTKLNFSLAKKIRQMEMPEREVHVLIKGNVLELESIIPTIGGVIKYKSGDIIAVRMALSKLAELTTSQNVFRIEDQEHAPELMNDRMLINNNILAVHTNWAGALPQTYDGSGVLMGVIDTGIDISHPDFKNVNGSTRIKYIWDHTLPNGTATPQPYNYGIEFTDSDIDGGLANAHVDQSGHGTHVTGIAASNGFAINNYVGAAPGTDLIIVSLDFNQADNSWLTSIADGVNYIFSKAALLNKPCVINISAGTYFGSHDGKDLQAQLIDNLLSSQNGRSVVCAAGNAGELSIHIKPQLSNDTLFTWFRRPSGTIYIDLWADSSQASSLALSIGADKTSPVYEYRGNLGFKTFDQHVGIISTDTLWAGTNRLAIVQSFGQLIGDRYGISYIIQPDSFAYSYRLMSRGSGMFDAWSFEMVSSGLPSTSVYSDMVNYVLPDKNQNIVSSFTCSDKVISVGEYQNRNFYTDATGVIQSFNITVGAHTPSSSQGPTRDGRIKPDLSSTGLLILSAANLPSVPWFLANAPDKLAAGAKHIRDGGTSSASPAVAGIVALYLQKNPGADYADIKNALINCAKKDAFTGFNLPDNTWGYGKADAYASMVGCATNVNELVHQSAFEIYPNPAQNNFTIALEFPPVDDWNYSVLDLSGRLIHSKELGSDEKYSKVNSINLSRGIYFIHLWVDGEFYSKKLVLN
ncbi:MAG TPA: S8/S53 family peptidase [Bacteroidia bacterium]|nr:S8/S53 family peptidase [Bacteroidia bacterium]HNT79465.1 S8/S53 family peptidase [Bacteroidia bacterium]